MLLGLIRTVDSICAGAVLALGHSRLILKLNIAYTFLGGILIWAAAQFSVQATMAAIVISNLILVPVFLHYTKKLTSIDVLRPLAVLPRAAAATAIMFAIVSMWRALADGVLPQTLVLTGAILIGALAYGAAALLLLRKELVEGRSLLSRLR